MVQIQNVYDMNIFKKEKTKILQNGNRGSTALIIFINVRLYISEK